ncbi:MAG: pyridoxine 5'-phosphate synthase [Kiritimatiellae bacterium]|nr:pyridoxine 5'-phosphate synthase [Kiritimatiellia bacterium]
MDAIRLGVNIDHVATLRQARGTTYPSVLAAALACERAGAHGITVHLREDRRHIQDDDVRLLRHSIATRLNLEMANSKDVLARALEVKPHEVCLVPERRAELTTEGGLDADGQRSTLRDTVAALQGVGTVVSLFVDPEPRQIAAAAELGAEYVELHTGAYCRYAGAAAEGELRRLMDAAEQAHAAGLGVNAGHGLTLENVGPILRLPWLDTLNIGHSIVAHAIFVGLEAAVRAMLAKLK